MSEDRADEESRALHRGRCVISTVTNELRTMGLYDVARDESGAWRPANLDPAQRRNLLVYLSELEELVKVLDGFKQDLAQTIEQASRSTQAVMTYRRTATTFKNSARGQTDRKDRGHEYVQ